MDSKTINSNTQPSTKSYSPSGRILSSFLLIGVVCSLLIQYNIPYLISFTPSISNITNRLLTSFFEYKNRNITGPFYVIYGKSSSESHLEHVFTLLNQMGLQRINWENRNDWDLLWAHDYPFRTLKHKINHLESHQLINHFPGCGYLTNKVDLATTNFPYIPSAFRLPIDKDNFLKYLEENPHKLFVEKHNEHRNIYIKTASEIDLTSNSTFVQEFVENPYLVDGYKFDIGVYVIITDINPLRVYIYKADVLFRFCPVKYHPFDPLNIDKYVVGDDYLPIWKVPSLSHYYASLKYSMKDSFDAYVKKHNGQPDVIWNQVEDIIRSIILDKEPKMIKVLKSYKYQHNFFELMRFDFILDENLRVFLMEANMSPNLSSAHFKQNELLYVQILYSVLNLIGIGLPIKRSSLKNRAPFVENIISSDKNIVVSPDICISSKCNNTCLVSYCQLCKQCLTDENKRFLHAAYREHIQKSDTKRIFPRPVKNLMDYQLEKEIEGLSPRNELMTRWFYGKCKMDETWCL